MITHSTVKLTYEDLLDLPDDGKRHELLDGDLRMTPAPSPRHQRVAHALAFALELWVRRDGPGEIFPAPVDVVLSDFDVVEPDLLYLAPDSAAEVTERNIQGPPDLVVEVLSPSNRRVDEITKRKLYERFGVREYWVVDPEIETVKVYRRGEDGLYGKARELALERDERLDSPLLPGLDLPLAEIF